MLDMTISILWIVILAAFAVIAVSAAIVVVRVLFFQSLDSRESVSSDRSK